MNLLKQKCSFLLMLFILSALISCSDNDKNIDPPSEPELKSALGSASLNFSGEIEGQHKALADFDDLYIGKRNTWKITMQDYSPQTFEVTIFKMSSTGGAARPVPGTYEIGGNLSSPNVYWATVVLRESESISEVIEYSSMVDKTGTLIIDASDDEAVSGSLEFTAHQYDPVSLEVLNTTTVTGSFIAKQKIFYY